MPHEVCLKKCNLRFILTILTMFCIMFTLKRMKNTNSHKYLQVLSMFMSITASVEKERLSAYTLTRIALAEANKTDAEIRAEWEATSGNNNLRLLQK